LFGGGGVTAVVRGDGRLVWERTDLSSGTRRP
jgi:hypothetical protein